MNITIYNLLKLIIWPITVIIFAFVFHDPIANFIEKTEQVKAPGGVVLNKIGELQPPTNPNIINVVQNNNSSTTETVTTALQRLSEVKDDLDRTKQTSYFWKGKTLEWVHFYFSNSLPIAINVLSWLAENQTNIISSSAYYSNWSKVMPDQNFQYSILVTLYQAGFLETIGNNIRITPLGIEFLQKFHLRPYQL